MSVQTKPGDVVPSNEVTLFIDGIQVSVPKGTMAIRAAEKLGIAIPRFCDHPLLDPQGACRECMVEVPDAGNGRGFPKPQTSCTLEVAPNMQIKTQNTSPVAAKAQSGILEFLLINHPLDCPICDKGGECPLQNQAMSNGRGETRYEGVKRTFPKPVSISAQILLDRERCVLCARCTRFSEQISGDPVIAVVERGNGALLQEFRHAGGRILHEIFKHLLQFRMNCNPADTPASHGVCLGNAVDGQRPFLQPGFDGGDGVECPPIEQDMLVDVVGQHMHPRMVEQHGGEALQLFTAIDSARRVRGRIEDQPFRLCGDGAPQCPRIRRPPRAVSFFTASPTVASTSSS